MHSYLVFILEKSLQKLKPNIDIKFNAISKCVDVKNYIKTVALASLRNILSKNLDLADVSSNLDVVIMSTEWKELLESKIPSWNFEFLVVDSTKHLQNTTKVPVIVKNAEKYVTCPSKKEGELDYIFLAIHYFVHKCSLFKDKVIVMKDYLNLEMFRSWESAPKKLFLLFAHLFLYYNPDKYFCIILYVGKQSLLGVAVVNNFMVKVYYFDKKLKSKIDDVVFQFAQHLNHLDKGLFTVSSSHFEEIEDESTGDDIRVENITQFVSEALGITSIMSLFLINKSDTLRSSSESSQKQIISFGYSSNFTSMKDKDKVKNLKHLELARQFYVKDFQMGSFSGVVDYLVSNVSTTKYKIYFPILVFLHVIMQKTIIKFMSVARALVSVIMESVNDSEYTLLFLLRSLINRLGLCTRCGDFDVVIYEDVSMNMEQINAFYVQSTSSVYKRNENSWIKITFTPDLKKAYNICDIVQTDILSIVNGCVAVVNISNRKKSKDKSAVHYILCKACISNSPNLLNDEKAIEDACGPFFEAHDVVPIHPVDNAMEMTSYSPTDEEAIKNALSSKGDASEIVRSFGKYNLTRHSMRKLRENEWINDDIIDAYIDDFQSRISFSSDIYICKTLMTCALVNSHGVYDYSTSAGKVDWDVELSSRKRLAFIMNEGGVHWFTVIVYLKYRTILCLDSLNSTTEIRNRRCETYTSHVCDYLSDRNRDRKCAKDHQKLPDRSVEWDVRSIYDCPHQSNYKDCGIFAIKFVEAAMSEDDPSKLSFNFNQDTIPLIRKYICHRILVTSGTTERQKNERMNKTTSPSKRGECQFNY